MADVLTNLLPNLTTATNQGKVGWQAVGSGYRSCVLHWELYLERTGDIVALRIVQYSGRAVFIGDIDDTRARDLSDAVVAQSVEPDDVSLAQFLGVLGSF